MNLPAPDDGARLLTFEVGGTAYALPIADVAEVSEPTRIAVVPTLPARVGGVVNHHGDALPVLHREVLFQVDGNPLPDPSHLLVLARSPDDPGSVGLPVDRVLGLVPGVGGTARDDDPVAERRPIDGRVVSVLDTRRLLLRAEGIIQRSVIGADPSNGSEL